MVEQLRDLVVSGRFDDWSDALAQVGNCAHPIQLRGTSERINSLTGEILSSYSSEAEPLGVTYVPCGNRRASECPSCSRVYAADMFQLIRAGISGGKTVPVSVAENPLIFATVTAPSFGRVHGNRGDHACGSPMAATAASLAVQAGAHVKAVQPMLGCASAAMTLDVYAGLFGDDLDAVADRLDEAAARARADSVRTPGRPDAVITLDREARSAR
jgi:hypothetical protein